MNASTKLANAINAGDIRLALEIANSVEYAAEMETAAAVFASRTRTPISTTAADNATLFSRSGSRMEAAILSRDEAAMHAWA